MKKNYKRFNGAYYCKLLTVIFVLLSMFTASFQFATAKNNEKVENNKGYVSGQLIVKFREGMSPDVDFLKTYEVSSAKKISKADKVESKASKSLKKFGIDRMYLVDLSKKSDLDKTMKDINKDSRIEYAGLNYIYHTTLTPNDPSLDQLWGLHNTGQSGGTDDADIDALEAWDIQTGSSDVVIAVIDTGVDYNHPDLAGNIWTNLDETPNDGIDNDENGFIDDVYGWDFANGDNDPSDDYGHGTHCAGTIGAVGDNEEGVVGVNWNVRIMPIKFMGLSGGTTADAILSVNYAVNNGADIMSNSWGGGGYSTALEEAISAANDMGILFIAAAGNEGSNNDSYPHYPSSYDVPNVVAVAATDHNDSKASFSCYGVTSVDLGAPGVNIYSTVPTGSCKLCDPSGYKYLNGTSMATPHVAGAAGIIKAQYPGLSALGIKSMILDGVDPIPSMEGITVTGGRLNVYNSLNYVSDDITPPSAVSGLAFSEATYNSVSLTWTATGDDGDIGIASKYDVRYSISEIITEEDWNNATQTVGEPEPQVLGSVENFTVKNLGFNTTYYFAVKVVDDVGNYSGFSNVILGTTVLDDVPPSAVSDLAFSEATYNSVSLTWTATGDDGSTGIASTYDVRYSTSVIMTEADWNEATQAQGEPEPQALGSEENLTVEDLEFNTTYYFALKVVDKVGNYSGLSDVISGDTKEVTVVFYDDMESGKNGWTHGGVRDNWQLGLPTSGPGYPYSGSNVWATNLDDNYELNNMNAELLSPSMDLTEIESTRLMFQHYYYTENYFDGGIVEISTNGGASWTQITPDGGYPEDSLYSGNPLGSVPAYSGSSGAGWNQAVFDISSYDGYSNVNIRFRFGTDYSVSDYPGWYIDDVVILGEDIGENLPPVAEAGVDQTVSDADGSTSETIVLDGSASYDPDGEISTYEWKEEDTILGEADVAIYDFPVGTHFVTLTVIDDDGATSTDEVIITVNENQAPIANAGDDQTVNDSDGSEGEAVTLDGSASDDSDGDIVSYEWKEGTILLCDSFLPTCYYDFSVGIHTVSLVVRDNAGVTDSDEVIITVDPNQAPIVEVSPDQTVNDVDGNDYEIVTLYSDAYDPDGTVLSYEWSENGAFLSSEPYFSYDYLVGTHTIILTVADDGGATATGTVLVTVIANQAPIAEAGDDQTSVEGATVNFDGSGSYDPDGSIASYDWDFGDGTTGTGVSPSHDYSTADTYTTTLTVTDNGGATSTDTLVVNVDAEPVLETTMHISDIVMSATKTRLNGWYTHASALVTIVGVDGTPVEGATVSGYWSGLTTDIDNDVETNSSGQAILESNAVKNAEGTFTFTVTEVSEAELTYDPNDNIETSGSVSVVK